MNLGKEQFTKTQVKLFSQKALRNYLFDLYKNCYLIISILFKLFERVLTEGEVVLKKLTSSRTEKLIF